MVPARGVLRGVRPGLSRCLGRRQRRPARADQLARLPAVARHRLPLAAADLRFADARRRLRHERLRHRPSRLRRARRRPRANRRGPRARDAGDRRPRPQPHQRSARVVRGKPSRP